MGAKQTGAAPKEACVLVFVRAPVVGRVKTRLAQALDPVTVYDLYRCFVNDLLETLEGSGYRIVLCYHPRDAEAQMIAWLGTTHLYLPQEGADLGARMADAFKKAFQRGFRSAILVGTDFPDLPETIVHLAFDGLKQMRTVIGPTVDGGYYLIGFERTDFLPAVFEGLAWGTEKVFENTLQIFNRHGRRPFVLPLWQDIDDFEDLLAFAESRTENRGPAPRTRAFLRSLNQTRD